MSISAFECDYFYYCFAVASTVMSKIVIFERYSFFMVMTMNVLNCLTDDVNDLVSFLNQVKMYSSIFFAYSA